MDNQRYGIRVTGEYALYQGREYFAHAVHSGVWLFCDDDPLSPGFRPSAKNWIVWEQLVAASEIQRLVKVQTTCKWRGHPFTVGIIVDDLANIYYTGSDFDGLSRLPGMIRPDKYEVQGKVPVSELTDLAESVEEVPLGDGGNRKEGRE